MRENEICFVANAYVFFSRNAEGLNKIDRQCFGQNASIFFDFSVLSYRYKSNVAVEKVEWVSALLENNTDWLIQNWNKIPADSERRVTLSEAAASASRWICFPIRDVLFAISTSICLT